MTPNLVFDFGTTSLKASLISDQELIGERDASYPVTQPHPGWAEQDPDMLWRIAGDVSRELMEDVGPLTIGSVVFIAPWKAVIPVDSDGVVLHPAIIWMDGRAQQQADAMNQSPEDTGVQTSQDYLPRVRWFREQHPDDWAAARWVMGANTFFKWKATGQVISDFSDSFINQDGLSNALACKALANADEIGKFPPVAPPVAIAGHITDAAATHLGIAPGVPVVNGFGDLPAITAGVDRVVPGAAHIYFGTSSWFAVVAQDADEFSAPSSFIFDRDTMVHLYPLQTGGMAFDWIVEELYGHERAHLSDSFMDHVNEIVAGVPAGSDKLIATHWLNGELPPLSKQAKGLYLNLTTSHTKAHMVRAMMESLCFTHRSSIESYERDSGRSITSITVVGGGASSNVWMQMLADVLHRRVVVPRNPRFTGIYGGNRCIEISVDPADSFHKPPREDTDDRVFSPDSSTKEIYDQMFAVYQRLHPALKEVFDELGEVSR